MQFPGKPGEGSLALRVVVDGGIVEAFAAGGRAQLVAAAAVGATNRSAPAVSLIASGGPGAAGWEQWTADASAWDIGFA